MNAIIPSGRPRAMSALALLASQCVAVTALAGAVLAPPPEVPPGAHLRRGRVSPGLQQVFLVTRDKPSRVRVVDMVKGAVMGHLVCRPIASVARAGAVDRCDALVQDGEAFCRKPPKATDTPCAMHWVPVK